MLATAAKAAATAKATATATERSRILWKFVDRSFIVRYLTLWRLWQLATCAAGLRFLCSHGEFIHLCRVRKSCDNNNNNSHYDEKNNKKMSKV